MRRLALPGALLALALAPAAARGEWSLTLLPGRNWVEDSDLRVERRGTDVRLRTVSWRDESFASPIYYDVALTRWSARRPAWGIGLDLTHAKAILQTDATALAQGTLDGRPVDAPIPVRQVLPAFQLSHGLNLATVTGYRRWEARRRADPYDLGDPERPGVALLVGVGAGVAVPHVEADLGGARTSEYQLGGPAARALVGLDVPIDRNLSLHGEATLSWADVRADLVGGGRVSGTFWVPQLQLGVAVRE